MLGQQYFLQTRCAPSFPLELAVGVGVAQQSGVDMYALVARTRSQGEECTASRTWVGQFQRAQELAIAVAVQDGHMVAGRAGFVCDVARSSRRTVERLSVVLSALRGHGGAARRCSPRSRPHAAVSRCHRCSAVAAWCYRLMDMSVSQAHTWATETWTSSNVGVGRACFCCCVRSNHRLSQTASGVDDGDDDGGDVDCVVRKVSSSSRHSILGVEVEKKSGKIRSGEASWAESCARKMGGKVPNGWRR